MAGDVDVSAGTKPGTVWIEVHNSDPVEDHNWAEISIDRARELAQQILDVCNQQAK